MLKDFWVFSLGLQKTFCYILSPLIFFIAGKLVLSSCSDFIVSWHTFHSQALGSAVFKNSYDGTGIIRVSLH